MPIALRAQAIAVAPRNGSVGATGEAMVTPDRPTGARRVRRLVKRPMPRSFRALQIALALTPVMLAGLLYFVYLRYLPDILDELQVPNGDPACANLTQWIFAAGGYVGGARCVHQPSSGGRAIVASVPLREGQTYARIPKDLWFWEESVVNHSAVGQLLDQDEYLQTELGALWAENGDPIRLTFALMYEAQHKQDSHWRPFIESMPSLPTSPLWWTESQIQQLESPVLAERIHDQQNNIQSQYDKYFPYLAENYPEYFNKSAMDLDMYMWSALHMYGRAFDATHHKDEDHRAWALIPFIDLVNHAGHPMGGYGDSKSDENPSADGPFTATVTQCTRPGGELFHSYGASKSATHYFITYGFIPTGYQSMDFVSVTLSWPAIKKLQILQSNKKRYKWTAGFAGTDGHITEGFIDSLAFYVQNLALERQYQLDDAAKRQTFDRSWGQKRALEIILVQVKHALGQFSTTLEQDMEDLEGQFTGYSNWVTLTARTRFKHILVAMVNAIEYRIANGAENSLAWPSEQAWWNLAYQSDYIGTRHLEDNIQNSLFRIEIPDSLSVLLPELKPTASE